jgi:hypothetical protein
MADRAGGCGALAQPYVAKKIAKKTTGARNQLAGDAFDRPDRMNGTVPPDPAVQTISLKARFGGLSFCLRADYLPPMLPKKTMVSAHRIIRDGQLWVVVLFADGEVEQWRAADQAEADAMIRLAGRAIGKTVPITTVH